MHREWLQLYYSKQSLIRLCVKWHLCKFEKRWVRCGTGLCKVYGRCKKLSKSAQTVQKLVLFYGRTPPMYHLWRQTACPQLTTHGPLHSSKSFCEHVPFSHSVHTSTIAGEAACQLSFFHEPGSSGGAAGPWLPSTKPCCRSQWIGSRLWHHTHARRQRGGI